MEKVGPFIMHNFWTWFKVISYTGNTLWHMKLIGDVFNMIKSQNDLWLICYILETWSKCWCHWSSPSLIIIFVQQATILAGKLYSFFNATSLTSALLKHDLKNSLVSNISDGGGSSEKNPNKIKRRGWEYLKTWVGRFQVEVFLLGVFCWQFTRGEFDW